jgi:predicted acylesterase/phospholipase RssA
MQLARFVRLVAVLALPFVVGACNAVRYDCPTCPKPPQPPPTLTDDCGSDQSALELLFTTPQTVPPAMLFMSAGGSWGAWGAGVLYGWGEATSSGTATTPRPKFHLVTGASTGALLGVFAILGGGPLNSDWSGTIDTRMMDAYTKTQNHDVFRRRAFWEIPFASSINTLSPLRGSLKSYIAEDDVKEIGRIYDVENRQLWVGTTNLDTGQFCNWNLSEIASAYRATGQPAHYERFIDLLIASSANPGIFDTVFIDRALHADGGVRYQLYTQIIRKAAKRYEAAAWPVPAGADPPQAYVIANSQLLVRRQCVVNQLVFVMLRSSQILMTAALDGDLGRALRRLRANVSPKWDMNTSFIPEDYLLWPSPDVFKPADMEDLFDRAKAEVVKPGHWVKNRVPEPDVSRLECIPPFPTP